MNKLINKPVKISKEIIEILKEKRIIIICGDMGSGKTTEAVEICNQLDKPTKVILPHEHRVDTELYDRYNIEKIIVKTGSKDRVYLKSKINEIKNCNLIYDDYHSSSIRQQKVIKDISIDLRKRRMRLILIYHGEDIPKRFLKSGNTILLIKRDIGFTKYKLGQYFKVKRVSSTGEEFCNSITGFDTFYILNNGDYYLRNGETNEITQGKLKPKGVSNLDWEKIGKLILDGMTQEEIGNKFSVSKSTISIGLQIYRKENPEWENSYQYFKKHKTTRKKLKNTLGKKTEIGVIFSILEEKVTEGKGTNIRKIVEISKLYPIGNVAVRIMGEGIYKCFQSKVDKGEIKKVFITIQQSLMIGVDIIIEIPEMNNKYIEIEVKNWKITTKQKKITKSSFHKKIKPRFSNQATDKWLFVCGRGCDKQTRRLLQRENIGYKRISWKQLDKDIKNINKDRKHNVKKSMERFVEEIIKK